MPDLPPPNPAEIGSLRSQLSASPKKKSGGKSKLGKPGSRNVTLNSKPGIWKPQISRPVGDGASETLSESDCWSARDGASGGGGNPIFLPSLPGHHPAMKLPEGWRTCGDCGAAMNPVEVMLGDVCGKCCRRNHRAVTRRRSPGKKSGTTRPGA